MSVLIYKTNRVNEIKHTKGRQLDIVSTDVNLTLSCQIYQHDVCIVSAQLNISLLLFGHAVIY